MEQTEEREQFGQWATNEYYELYQDDPVAALRTAHERSEILSADDRRVLALAFSSVAAGAGEKAALFGGGKVPVWLVMGAISVTMAQFGMGGGRLSRSGWRACSRFMTERPALAA